MRVALLCGYCPSGTCGVSDYTARLAESLSTLGVETDLVRSGRWSLRRTLETYLDLGRLSADILHIQYPTCGFGRKLGPQAQAMLRRCVITLHELSQAHILRKLASLPFTIYPRNVIFPSEVECRFAVRWAPWISRRSSVIPIPSNIRAAEAKHSRSQDEIVYFGLIMPKKGLEDVIKVAALIKSNGLALKVRVIGTPPVTYEAYFEELRSKTSSLPIIWEYGLNDEQVADRLASSSVAYLPYPDGVSERRASIKAALINGVAVITTRGRLTPVDLEGLVHFSQSPEAALSTARFLLDSPEDRAELVAKADLYMKQFRWERVAQMHLAVYNGIMRRESRRLPAPKSYPSYKHDL